MKFNTKKLAVIVQWSEEDSEYIARLRRAGYADEELEQLTSRLSEISAFGRTRVIAVREFQIALGAAIRVIKEDEQKEPTDPTDSELLKAVICNLLLLRCEKCRHLHMGGHVCYECKHDPSIPEEND